MTTFPRGALYGDKVPPKHEGPVPGIAPPPPARVPEVPYFTFPESNIPVPEFPAPVHRPMASPSQIELDDGEKLPSNNNGPFPTPPQQEPAVPVIKIPTPPPPPPIKTFPRSALYEAWGELPQAEGSPLTGARAEPRPDKVPPPHSPLQGSPSGPRADEPSTYF